MILFHLRFLFIRLPSSRRCGLAETVGLCFRVDSDRVTLGFVLGLVCVWTICIDVKLLLVVLVFPVSTLGLQGHRPIVDTCANEAIPQWGKRRLITSVYLHQFSFSSMATG